MLVWTWGEEAGGKWGVTNNRYRVSFRDHENVPKLTVEIACITLNIPKTVELNILSG